MTQDTIDRTSFRRLLESKVVEVVDEPEYNWANHFKTFMTDDEGKPVVRVAITNCPLDTDIWEGLRTPAHVGMYPLTPDDIWKHYACMNVKTTRYDGSPNPLAMPETFDDAMKRFRHLVILCGMLAVNPQVYQIYAEKIERGDEDPFHYYCRATGDVDAIIDKSIGKAALALMGRNRAVVPMTNRNTKVIIDRTRGEYHKGRYHGPCNNHWPNGSLAVMTGLLRFGVNRLPFRDEATENGERHRLFGRYRSIVIFDGEAPATDNAGGITLLGPERMSQLRHMSDYTKATPDVQGQRYCTYNLTRSDGGSMCGMCLSACPSGALRNSTPRPDGTFDADLARQEHRFWNGTIDFDFGNCCRDRGQKAQLYDEYVCARCEAICAARGIRRSASKIQRINEILG